jgi:hypothetical protein
MGLICELCGLPSDPPDGLHSRCMQGFVVGTIGLFDMKMAPFRELKPCKSAA